MTPAWIVPLILVAPWVNRWSGGASEKYFSNHTQASGATRTHQYFFHMFSLFRTHWSSLRGKTIRLGRTFGAEVSRGEFSGRCWKGVATGTSRDGHPDGCHGHVRHAGFVLCGRMILLSAAWTTTSSAFNNPKYMHQTSWNGHQNDPQKEFFQIAGTPGGLSENRVSQNLMLNPFHH